VRWPADGPRDYLDLLLTLSAVNRNSGEAVRQNASRSVGHSGEQRADDVAQLPSFTALSQR
jgi:hypothetical protein